MFVGESQGTTSELAKASKWSIRRSLTSSNNDIAFPMSDFGIFAFRRACNKSSLNMYKLRSEVCLYDSKMLLISYSKSSVTESCCRINLEGRGSGEGESRSLAINFLRPTLGEGDSGSSTGGQRKNLDVELRGLEIRADKESGWYLVS